MINFNVFSSSQEHISQLLSLFIGVLSGDNARIGKSCKEKKSQAKRHRNKIKYINSQKKRKLGVNRKNLQQRRCYNQYPRNNRSFPFIWNYKITRTTHFKSPDFFFFINMIFLFFTFIILSASSRCNDNAASHFRLPDLSSFQ